MEYTEKIFRDFISYSESNRLKIEGIAVADGDQVLMEHHFTYDKPRNIYSHTKSYTVTAVGMAIQEGKLSPDTKLTELFPEKVPEDADPRIHDIELQHLLKMSSGFGEPLLMGAHRRAGIGFPDYIKYMLSQPVKCTPGERFCYSTADSILAGRMVERAVGENLLIYLYRHLFSRLGQGFPTWECCPEGHPIGGGGIEMKLTEMMKIGQLYMNMGIWKGERLLEEDWVKKCTSKQIDTVPNPDDPDPWNCGYGYQFWMSPYPNAYRADGAYGQITTVLPEKGLVVAVQCPEDGDFYHVTRNEIHANLLTPLSEA